MRRSRRGPRETVAQHSRVDACLVRHTRFCIPPGIGHIYKELIPNCHLVFVYDAGHAISTERPEALTEVVADFLERHEAFIISRTETVIHP
jgi:pimeloyl-ACP methyl ester carboxylesterase